MKKIILAFILFITINATAKDKTVTLTVTGQGKTIEEAKNNALRSAVEEALALTATISNKIEADEKRAWEFKMKKYADEVQLEQQRIKSSKSIAIEYAKHQPKTIIYNNLI